ncbi:MAG: glycosyltransferase family 39 protein, partial [Tepidimonas sp.]|uniref:glycosyltransferase family 39 protein n=1 Tax=Tepidimonas sp. TaxID=2002775 RepID=UPI004054AABD
MIRHGHASLDHADQRLWYAFLAAMAAYFGVHAAVRVLVSPSPELDEAEQLIWTQHRALGYGTQPPLYTWLQALWFDVVGVSVLGLTTFKNGLLWVCHVAVAAALRPIVGTRAAIVAAASMLWLPTIGWESQRDLTHTVLATALAAVGLWLFVRIALHGRWQDYLVFGLVAGAGLLAKYNFMLFLAVLVTAAAGVPALRPRVFTTHTVLSVSVALAVVAPHLLWVLNHWDAASVQTLDKMTAHAGNTAAERLGGAALALLAFATPWWAAFAAALALDRRAGRKRPP